MLPKKAATIAIISVSYGEEVYLTQKQQENGGRRTYRTSMHEWSILLFLEEAEKVGQG